MLNKMMRRCRRTPPVTSLFIAVFIIFAVILFWSTTERQESYDSYQFHMGQKAAENAKDAVINALDSRKRFVNLFVEENIDLIRELSKFPDNEELFELVKQKLLRYIPDLFTINITTEFAELLIDDFEGFTGPVCLNDVRLFAESGEHLVRVHPNHILYHYDVLTSFQREEQTLMFFASFNLDVIKTALQHSSPQGHELVLIRETPEMLLEVTESGGRNTIKNRLDFRLTENEISRVLSKTKIPGTDWIVLDMIDPSQAKAFNKKLIVDHSIVFIIFTLLLVMVRYLVVANILRQSKKINKLNKSLKELLVIDPLTGLYNKSYLDTQLQKEWSRATRENKKISVILVDVDHFKLYNDNYGHLQGDQCLKQLSHLMQETFQRDNDFVARFGGEEFCIVLNDSSADSPEYLVEKLFDRLSKLNIAHEYSPTVDRITVSVGIATVIPVAGMSQESLFQKADEALYRAKNGGRNQMVTE